MTNIAGDEWGKVFWNATFLTQNVLQVTFIELSGAKTDGEKLLEQSSKSRRSD